MHHFATELPRSLRSAPAGGALRQLFEAWTRGLQTRRRCAELQNLDDRTLRDIGLSRSELLSVARGPDATRVRSAAF